MQHKDIQSGNQHIIHNWKVADIAARDALVVANEDIDKVCLVMADDYYYRLKSVSPSVWVQVSGSGGGGSSVWGGITGTLADQLDLQAALDGKADKTDTYTKSETNTQISTAVSNLVDTAPAVLDTLNELANALGDDPNFATTVTTAIGNKADKIGTSDIEITDATKGVILKSPNGTRYRITIADDGAIITTAI